jgi:PAS domain S-box-containing protein
VYRSGGPLCREGIEMTANGLGIAASHDHRLVALSIVVSIVAAYAAINLAERIRAGRGRVWVLWLTGAAITDGIGTCSMHYTGMLALRLPVPLQFDWRLVLLSLAVSIAGSGAAFLVVRSGTVRWPRAVAGGALLGGGGISGMHYTGMAAMRMPGMDNHYSSPPLVILSIVLAVVASTAALAPAFLLKEHHRPLRRHSSAVLRGIANPVMHYSAMAGVVFVATRQPIDLSHTVGIASLSSVGIGFAPLLVLIVATLTSVLDRLHKQGALLEELFEQSPEAVVLTDEDGRIVRANREFGRQFGYRSDELVGRGLIGLTVAPEEATEIEALHRAGRREIEGIHQRKDGTRLRVSTLRVPVTLPGGRAQTYAILRDITEARKTEEALRDYPRRLIEMQEAEAQRIARELHDEVGQVLTGAVMMLSRLDGSPESQARLAEATSALKDLAAQVRNIALDLRPGLLDDFGLVAALDWMIDRYIRQTGVEVDLIHEGLDGARFDPEVEITAYRIVQEALTNVARHAGTQHATVRIARQNALLTAEIEDRGAGFNPEEVPVSRTMGLISMRERSTALRGRLTIVSKIGEGTRVAAELPLNDDDRPQP